MSKDLKQLLARLRKQGFAIRFGGSGHYRITSPAGRTITIPATPHNGPRSHHNMRAALRRIGAQL